jgi:DNA-binding transcriptional regulator YdaS (Cro superfamily)
MNKFNDFVKTCGTQHEAARLLGVSRGFISHMQTGRRTVSINLARQVERLTDGDITLCDLRPDIFGK